ncbi:MULTISPECIES: hypothetical protein [Thiorhodovibrio]|uniref:hypothetical protein n=1 Tax=Thiorhodovibrio TaxID=61593 RepID=UPI001F5D87CF|nr:MULTISPECIES: hypothetical protein [Thiorhodovibrio]
MNLRDACSGCHNKPGDSLHRGIVYNCGQCHSQQAWTPATIDHDRFFLRDGDHQAACETCHINNDVRRYTCYGCHEHSRSKIRGEHVEEGIDEYENCVECHRSGEEDHEDWRESGDHEKRRWKLGDVGRFIDLDDGQRHSRGYEDDDDEDDD